MTTAKECACVGSVGDAVTHAPSRVLVIDDDATIARGAARMLHGYDVEIETDPRHALARVQADEHFDVIVCDQQMPDLDGHAVRAAIHDHFVGRADEPCIVMMSGGLDYVGSMDDESRLLKPFHCKELRAFIDVLLANRHPASSDVATSATGRCT